MPKPLSRELQAGAAGLLGVTLVAVAVSVYNLLYYRGYLASRDSPRVDAEADAARRLTWTAQDGSVHSTGHPDGKDLRVLVGTGDLVVWYDPRVRPPRPVAVRARDDPPRCTGAVMTLLVILPVAFGFSAGLLRS